MYSLPLPRKLSSSEHLCWLFHSMFNHMCYFFSSLCSITCVGCQNHLQGSCPPPCTHSAWSAPGCGLFIIFINRLKLKLSVIADGIVVNLLLLFFGIAITITSPAPWCAGPQWHRLAIPTCPTHPVNEKSGFKKRFLYTSMSKQTSKRRWPCRLSTRIQLEPIRCGWVRRPSRRRSL